MSQLEAMFDEIENFGYDAYYGSYIKKLAEIRDKVKEAGDETLSKRAQLELEVLSLAAKPPIIEENYQTRFIPMYEWNNGQKWPDVSTYTSEDFLYIKSRLDTTKNVFLRCRYADFLIEYGNSIGVKAFPISKDFIQALDSVVDSYAENNDDIGLIQLLARGFQISLKMKNKDMLQLVTNKAFSFIEQFTEGKKYRWILELSEMIREVAQSQLASMLAKSQYERCYNALVAGKQHYWDEKGHHLHRSFCEEALNWNNIVGFTFEEFEGLRLEIGTSFEEEAIHQQGRNEKSALVQAHFYEMAMEHYSNIGSTEKIEEMKVKIRQSYEQARGEVKTISISINVPTETIESIIRPYLEVDSETALAILSTTKTFFPNLSSIEEQTKRQEKDTPLQFLVDKSILDDGKKVMQAIEDNDNYKMAYDSNYMLYLTMSNTVLLTPIIDRLVRENGLTSDEFIKKIISWSLMSSQNAPLVEIGIRKFFDDDYVSSLHILVPQFESCLRRMFSQAGFATTSIKRGMAQHEETFNEFLNRDEIKEVLGESFHKFIQMIMVEQTGLNLRNKIAHGLINVEDCSKQINNLILFLYLQITKFVLNDGNTNS